MKTLRRNKYRFSLFIAGTLSITLLAVLLSRGMKHVKEVDMHPEVRSERGEQHVPAIKKLPEIPPFREFIHFMEGELDTSHTVGAAYAMVSGGQVEYLSTYGERFRGSGEEVNEHTLFRLASVSKGFAGTLACLLENEGIFSLDDRVLDHYPGFRLKDSSSTNGMTIRNLLSHTTGLVPYAFDNLVEAGESLPHIVDRLNEVAISGLPGTLYGYQNVTFSMLDPIVRRVTGTPYQVLMNEMIFRPLQMKDASVGPVDKTPDLNMASPHVRGRDGYIALNPHEGYYNVLPAAGVNASITDMGQWLLALLGHQPGIVPKEVLETIEEPVIYTPLKYRYTRYWKPFQERYYSLGWRIYHYRGKKIVYHGGYIRGYRAEIGFCPEEDIGIVFLQNSPNNLASRVVPQFFDLYLDHQEKISGSESFTKSE